MGQPLAMQMSVCPRHPVIMLYLCPMLFRRKPSGGRPVSCSLTAHWLHRPDRLLEARVMKADIASCLWAKAHGYVLRPRQGVGLRGIPFPQSRASGFGPSLPIPPRSLSFIPMAAIHGLIQRAVFKLVRYSSFSPILLSQMTQCGASGIAAHCIGHRSALRWLLQRTASSVPR